MATCMPAMCYARTVRAHWTLGTVCDVARVHWHAVATRLAVGPLLGGCAASAQRENVRVCKKVAHAYGCNRVASSRCRRQACLHGAQDSLARSGWPAAVRCPSAGQALPVLAPCSMLARRGTVSARCDDRVTAPGQHRCPRLLASGKHAKHATASPHWAASACGQGWLTVAKPRCASMAPLEPLAHGRTAVGLPCACPWAPTVPEGLACCILQQAGPLGIVPTGKALTDMRAQAEPRAQRAQGKLACPHMLERASAGQASAG